MINCLSEQKRLQDFADARSAEIFRTNLLGNDNVVPNFVGDFVDFLKYMTMYVYAVTICHCRPTPPRAVRELELFKLPLSVLVEEYKCVKGISKVQSPPELNAIRVSELIKAILDAEYPQEK